MGAQNIIGAINNGLSQSNRLLKLDNPLGDNLLLPQRVIGYSQIGRHFEFTADLVSASDSIELKTLIAQSVTLWIQQNDQSFLPHHGYVHTARRLGADSGLTSYQIVFASWLHFLRFRSDARIWQDAPADQILTDVFNMHPQAQGAFRFALSKPLPSRSFCVQFEDDWNFVHRIMECEGIFGYFEQASDGKSHTLVITDHLDACPPLSPQTIEFYRAGAGSEANALVQWAGTRTLQSTSLATRTFDYKLPASPANPKGTHVPTLPTQGALPPQNEVYEYTGAYTYGDQDRGDRLSKIRMEEWESRAKRYVGAAGVRSVDAGRWFELDNHPGHATDNAQNRQFVVIKAAWFIENNLPVSHQTADFPHSLKSTLARIESHHAAGRLKIRHDDGNEGFFLVEIEAQRKSMPYRSPLEHHKPAMNLQSAIVVGPANEEVYTDALNRIKVRFHWDRLNDGDEKASCWVRVAMSDTGGGYGSVHVPRIGEEVLISWADGDCDRPLVTGKVYNSATKPNWHSNGLLSGYRSREYQGSGFNQMVMDDATGQNRVQFSSSSTRAQLHLGYLIEHSGNTRGNYLGSGFDLRSDAYGAVRAGRGLYISTWTATSQQMDVQEAHSQLTNSASVLGALSEASTTHHAESLNDGHAALTSFTAATQQDVSGSTSPGRTAGGGTGNANAFGEPVMLLASPAGIALSTQQSVHLAAHAQANLVSGQNTHLATSKSLIASVREKLSLFAQSAGMKFFAAKGKVELRAHSDNIELTAQKTVKVISATEQIEAAAKQEILLTSGGAYIRIKNGNIEIHAPGQIDIKGALHSFAGPTGLKQALPVLPVSATSQMFSQRVDVKPLLGEEFAIPFENIPYAFKDENGNVVNSGRLDADGLTDRVFTPGDTNLKLYVGDDPWRVFVDSQHGAEHDDAPSA
ncbi:type VI secretion system Vgr family protein [Paraburkholderia acidisoli]|uniref:Type VI secretion system tip protein VgrG n=1 Tax=Paraburkholderia acidisoli TaxID=2571748 RepID=A0A7Z2GGT2_9BURK|nr:type VI secretion system Vgr family protein [Paraburkholderia acidisoli]QGZ61165.1 type VI secretion system tip protein VgrG [Paraburkholderia acidisoli]